MSFLSYCYSHYLCFSHCYFIVTVSLTQLPSLSVSLSLSFQPPLSLSLFLSLSVWLSLFLSLSPPFLYLCKGANYIVCATHCSIILIFALIVTVSGISNVAVTKLSSVLSLHCRCQMLLSLSQALSFHSLCYSLSCCHRNWMVKLSFIVRLWVFDRPPRVDQGTDWVMNRE